MKKNLNTLQIIPRWGALIIVLFPCFVWAATIVPTATIAPVPGAISMNNIKEYNGCQIHADPLFDYAGSDDGYILFDVKPTMTGKFSFDAVISTGTGKPRFCTLGPIDDKGNFLSGVTEKEIPAGTNSSDWTISKANYVWEYELSAGQTYTIKVAYRRNGEAYGVNLYSINITSNAAPDYTVTYYNEAFSTEGATYTVFTAQPYKQGTTIVLPNSSPVAPNGMALDYWAKADGSKVKTGDAALTMSVYPVWVKAMTVIGSGATNVDVNKVKEWSNCVAKGSQLIDMARNGSYILFDVKALYSGYYTFSSNIATSLNEIRCALGYVDKQGVFVTADTIDIANSGSWTTTKTYKWNFYLEADTTYTFKMLCFAGSGYALNTFSITIAPFVADVDLGSVSVNGFLVIPKSKQYATDAFFDNDLAITAKPRSSTGKTMYTARCNDKAIEVSPDGKISKALFKVGDVVHVDATIVDGPVSSDEYRITVHITDKRKKQIRGTTLNDGYWSNIGSSTVQSWTDYIYSLNPSGNSTRFTNGTWSTNGAKVQQSATSAFATASGATQLDEVVFTIDTHTAGKPINIATSDTDCRFYVVFGYQELADTKAPVLVSQNINNNDVLPIINGYITLRFDEAVKLSSTANATLNGQNAKLKIENNVFVSHFFYGLAYESNHTFVLKANSVEDVSGNKNTSDITISFATGKKAIVAKKVFDFVVGVNGTIDQAIAAANAAPGANRFYILVPNGAHELKGNDGDRMTTVTRNNISIIGQSKDSAIIANTPVSYGISTTATIHLKSASNTYMQDITIKNNRGEAGQGQQVALYDRSSKNIFKNVKLFSFQDTYVSGDRAYWDRCEIFGSTDYICGGGNVFFDSCLLYNRAPSGSKITAPATSTNQKWGYVFYHCTIDGGDYVLGRPWQNEPRAYFLYTKMNRQPSGTGWEGMGGLVTHFYEYKSMDQSGKLLDLSKRGNSPTSTNTYVPVLTDEAAAEFTMYNVLSGTEGWVPSDYTVQVEAPSVSINGQIMSWTDNPDALCTVVFKDGVFLLCTIENQFELTGNGTYTVQMANEMGGLGEVTSIDYIGTGVEQIKQENVIKSSPTKGIFDLMGRRLKQEPERGFYIKDGVKCFKR
jgi:uncharacterized protein YlzI (FlbEa/FlbD family)